MVNPTKLSEYDYEAEKKLMRQGDFLHHQPGNSLPWSAPNSMRCVFRGVLLTNIFWNVLLISQENVQYVTCFKTVEVF